MSERGEYKPTLMDRHGPSGADIIRVLPYCCISFLLVGVALTMLGVSMLWIVFFSVLGAVGTAWFAMTLSQAAGKAYQHLMMDGSSTPYVEQYSYQQALVMKGQIDEALESFEA